MLYKSTVGSVDIHIDTKRIEENLKRAQNELDVTVLRDMKNYIPAGQQKAMRNHTYIAQPGLIETDVVYAHYQYVGMLRTDEEGRVVVGKDETKPILTKTPLVQHTPGTTNQWFETAKQEHGSQWLDLVRREAGKG